jgi:ribonucleoside-diphosphate reductase alpha chain|tara:strand:- start:46 stop:1989 length:1944 start_codon:yes stop_codon:yes gene_type:complete
MSLPSSYQDFIHLSRYSRWLENENRRETWEETVDRYFNFFEKHLKDNHNYVEDKEVVEELRAAVLNLEVMPSMRALMTAGTALERENVAGYNCSFVAMNNLKSFDEILYVLMCGTGVGFSVERDFVNKLPTLAEEFSESHTTIVVQDSKLGWAKAYRELVSLLVNGQVPKWDLSKVRPAGARLKTFGGRASGPEPLEDLFRFTVDSFSKAAGRKLNSIEVHDIVCKIAEIVVVGGVRRSALISLSSLTDERMRDAKTGQWWDANPQRALANNSVAYKERPEIGTFMDEWVSLYKSKSGERGMFNRKAAVDQVASVQELRGDDHVGRNPNYEFGTNPCSEIILRDKEFCNLSEVVIRVDDDKESLMRKVRLASILGTWQSTLTNFKYLSSVWKKNCEEERLLGVSLTGIMDCPLTNGETLGLAELLTDLRVEAVDVNKQFAEKIGINQSASVTCVKPSGTVSQLVDAASGIHARHSPYYIRTVRADIKDPLCKFMIDKGFPAEPCVMKPDHTMVFSFPIKSPDNATCRSDMTALEQLEMWRTYQNYWCEHKPSVTITVKEDEWMEVGSWVWKYFDQVSGISFLPHSDHSYRQAPYQDCDEETYINLLSEMPVGVDWSELASYEETDNTSGTQTFACSGDSCEVVDLTS